jgi:hypothetical protein
VQNTGGAGGGGGANGGSPVDDGSGSDGNAGDPNEDVDPDSGITDPNMDGTSDGMGDTPAPVDGDQKGKGKIDGATSDMPAPDGQQRKTGDNYWYSAKPGDAAYSQFEPYANAHKDASLVGAHGCEGCMTDVPDSMTLMNITKGKTGPLIMASCDAGAKGPSGDSNAGLIADSAGIPRTNSYGCTGSSASVDSSQMYCDGSWVDGNGNAVTSAQRGKYGLKNCTITQRNSSGGWVKYNCQ